MSLYLEKCAGQVLAAVAARSQVRKTAPNLYAGLVKPATFMPRGTNIAEQNGWIRANARASKAQKSRLIICLLAPRLFWLRPLWLLSLSAAALARPTHAQMSWPHLWGTPSIKSTHTTDGWL